MKIFLARTFFVLTLLSLVFSFGMCAYTSYHMVGMGGMHHSGSGESFSHAEHALSLSLAILPSILILALCLFFVLQIGSVSSPLTLLPLRFYNFTENYRPEDQTLLRVQFSLRSPPKY